MQSKDFSELVQARYSVRDFRPDPIPADVLAEILDDARHAPSWSNTRPYLLAVASGDRTDRLRAAYLARFDESLELRHRERGAFLRAWLRRTLPDGDFPTWKRYPDELRKRSVKVGVGLYQQLGIVRGDRDGRDAHARRNLAFFGAPTVAFLLVHEDLLPFSAHDGGLMLQTLMLSATAHGVGSCAMGELATWRSPLETEFDLDPKYKLVTGLALGYPSDAPVNQFRAEHLPVPQAPTR
ncbi:nitroreductase [Propionicimonas paludicola]|uniref:Nitroreductase n=1 Tax=Propionicimonas paludicola TaxID=185243 RepID=A0A2A9CMG2_9ACTN|nr:nitroreductase [Propionicimonas paludicola]PFG15594.1 nitroreductase [Propionicimonas paludicola]